MQAGEIHLKLSEEDHDNIKGILLKIIVKARCSLARGAKS